ncbi:MAG: T9SS type A sorting domain-containing protein, partial [Ignavibacteria bacterium]|nr:T9SS type A sorting domain-containing protein [Ignavibacteria bacterium]
ANAVVVDDSGYVYVTGRINYGGSSYGDRATIKYKPNGDSVWVRIYSLPSNQLESGVDIQRNSSGFIFVTGVPLLQKYDNNGNILWTRSDSSIYNWPIGGSKILFDRDSNICILSPHLDPFTIISKINPDNGNLIFRKYFHFGIAGSCYDMAIDNNNNIIIAGTIANGPAPPNYIDFYVLKCNSAGDSLWSWRYNGPDPVVPYDIAYAVTVDNSGNIYATGFSDNEIGQSQFFTVKLTPNGDTVWTRRFSIGGSDAWNIDLDNQGNIYVSVRTNVTSATVVKYDNNGTLLWNRTIGQMPLGDIPKQTVDGTGIYITGPIYSANGILVTKYDFSGNQLWSVSYAHGSPTNIVVTKRNFYICGNTGSVDFLTLKYSQPIGIEPISNEIPESFKLYQNYPNPFNPETRIKFQIPEQGYVRISVFDLLGREVEKLVNDKLTPGTYEINWNAENLPGGVYFCRFDADGYSETKKMVVIK